jgi:hypothetical protein
MDSGGLKAVLDRPEGWWILSEADNNPTTVAVDCEVALTGGRITTSVVRVGETVRRPVHDSSEFVARLLQHLERLNVPWAPRYLGRDERDRDIFTYIPGCVPSRWGYFADDQVRAAARLLRSLHDATSASVLCADRSVVCHHDFGPNNAVFQDEHPVAMIDFDMIAPGEPLEDLGYSAWAWCISSRPSRPPVDVQAHQVRLLADEYGLDGLARSSLVEAILERQERNARFWRAALDSNASIVTPVDKISEIIEWSRREAAYVAANRHFFELALT